MSTPALRHADLKIRRKRRVGDIGVDILPTKQKTRFKCEIQIQYMNEQGRFNGEGL